MDPSLLSGNIRAALGACSLGSWPTPLEPASALADAMGLQSLDLKREDRSAHLGGGNKVRGLEFLFAGARPGTVFVTIGGTGSTHCLATAAHARSIGCRAVLAQFPQPATPASEAVASACAHSAAGVVRARSVVMLPVAVARAWRLAHRLGSPRWIPGGGAAPRAVAGHLLGGLELAAQLRQPPDAIVTPLGTGGTAAGLVLAVAALDWPTRIVAARVAPAIVANRWRLMTLVRRTARLLGLTLASRPPLMLECQGRGYGWPTPAGEDARERAAAHGLLLDSTYGAKAFAALPDLRERGFRRIVFWHTFALPPALAGPTP